LLLFISTSVGFELRLMSYAQYHKMNIVTSHECVVGGGIVVCPSSNELTFNVLTYNGEYIWRAGKTGVTQTSAARGLQ
jgi:hypothetical protein